jgi:hypothetical protein
MSTTGDLSESSMRADEVVTTHRAESGQRRTGTGSIAVQYRRGRDIRGRVRPWYRPVRLGVGHDDLVFRRVGLGRGRAASAVAFFVNQDARPQVESLVATP